MSWLATAVFASTVYSGYEGGKAVKDSAEHQRMQLAKNAARREHEGEMDAAEVRRKNRILLGDARAAMAGSGGTTTDPQALQQLGDIAGAGKFNEMSYLLEARLDAESMREGGSAVVRSARAESRAIYANTISSVLTGSAVSGLMGKYSDWKSNRAAKPSPSPMSASYPSPMSR